MDVMNFEVKSMDYTDDFRLKKFGSVDLHCNPKVTRCDRCQNIVLVRSVCVAT